MLAGASRTYLIEGPLAAALGAGLPIQEPRGRMVVDIGSGTTSAAVMSMGRIIQAASLRIGGEAFNEGLIRHLRDRLNIQIDRPLAEEIKLEIGTVSRRGRRSTQIIRGRDNITGLPTSLRLSSQDTVAGLEEPLTDILACIHRVLEKTPPELAADLLEEGIVLTGGGALLEGMDECIQAGTHVRTRVAASPRECVARGAAMALEDRGLLEILEGK